MIRLGKMRLSLQERRRKAIPSSVGRASCPSLSDRQDETVSKPTWGAETRHHFNPALKPPGYCQSPLRGSNPCRPVGTLDSSPVIYYRDTEYPATFFSHSGISRNFRMDVPPVPRDAGQTGPRIGARGDEWPAIPRSAGFHSSQSHRSLTVIPCQKHNS